LDVRYLSAITVLSLSLSPSIAAGIASAAPAAPQVLSGPASPPVVNAADQPWYVQREPVAFAGQLYYPAGATLFFNGNSMVVTGSYRGVPLYADTTIEPYSIVYVPIGRGLVQPYERPRRGELAGTTGSRAPSFPVSIAAARDFSRGAAMPPVLFPPMIPGATDRFEPGATGTAGRTGSADARLARDGGVAPRAVESQIIIVRRPEGNDGLWVPFAGQRWLHSGVAVPLTETGFVRVGTYAGFPVFAKDSLDEDVIYLPTRAGAVAPYRLKE
jgi:hypothetical protein